MLEAAGASEATAEAATEATATVATTVAATVTTTSTEAAGATRATEAGTRSHTHGLTHLLRSEEIETVVHAQHDVAVDGIRLRVATHHCVQHTGEAGLLTEDVVELQTDAEGLAPEERLGDLCVPYQLVVFIDASL